MVQAIMRLALSGLEQMKPNPLLKEPRNKDEAVMHEIFKALGYTAVC